MKKLLSLLFFLPVFLFAQKAEWRNDSIFKDGKAYALMSKSGGLEALYSIKSLSGTEIMLVKFDASAKDANGRDYYRVSFLGSGATGHFPSSVNMGKKLAQAVVDNNLIVDNAANPDGEKRFLAVYPMRTTGSTVIIVNNNSNVSYTTVNRSRNAPLFVNNGSIKQSGQVIGSYTSVSNSENGKTRTTITFSLPNGTVIAIATVEGIAANNCTVVTQKDNAAHQVNITNSTVKEKEIAEWLSENLYL